METLVVPPVAVGGLRACGPGLAAAAVDRPITDTVALKPVLGPVLRGAKCLKAVAAIDPPATALGRVAQLPFPCAAARDPAAGLAEAPIEVAAVAVVGREGVPVALPQARVGA